MTGTVFAIYNSIEYQREFFYLVAGADDIEPSPRRAALYLEFACEAWFGIDTMLLPDAVADLLERFYGYRLLEGPREPVALIDLHAERVRACEIPPGAERHELLADTRLHREGLREAMRPHLHALSEEASQMIRAYSLI